MGGILARALAPHPCRVASRSVAFARVFLCFSLALAFTGCKHVQPLDTKPLDASGMSYETIKRLESLHITAPEVAELATARSAGFSDAGCVEILQISRGRGEPFRSGEAVAGLTRVGMRDPNILELATLNQLGIGVGELQAIRLTGLSDAIVLEVARHRAAGKPELSGVSLASMKNAGMRESTLLELARRGIPDADAASIIASRRHGATDAEILRRYAGS